MRLAVQPSQRKAVEQWDSLKDRLAEYGAELSFVIPREGLPDMVFTANAGLYLKDKNVFVLSNFKYEQRGPETWWFHQFFAEQGVRVVVPACKFEGAGDALFLGGTLVGGYGFRTDRALYQEIGPMLDKEPVTVQLVDPHFYHLDTCFCPLADQDYLIYPGAFDAEGLEAIRGLGGREIAIDEVEAKKFACNAVQVGKTVIMPSGCPNTMQKLQESGYAPVATDMSEFLKSGGACKCLTLEI